MITNLENYILEKYGTETNVKHLTKLLFNKINEYIPKIFRSSENITINNYLEKNSSKIKFKNDKIILILNNKDKKSNINNPNIENNIIENLILTLNINYNQKELKNKYLSEKNKLKTDINHEMNHIMELYLTQYNNNKKSKSWDFNIRLNKHKEKFSYCDKWLEFLHIFYLMEEHEIRSRISSMREYLQQLNTNNVDLLVSEIKKSNMYIDCDNISKLNGRTIIDIMKSQYKAFDVILSDFVKNVMGNKSINIEDVFIKEIQNLNIKAKKMKKKLLKTLYTFLIIEDCIYLEENISKDIDFTDYI
jgi:hypothetical protein